MDALSDDLKKLTGEDEAPENPFEDKVEASVEQEDEEIEEDDVEEEEGQEQEDREFSMKKLFKLPAEVASIGISSLKELAQKVKTNLQKSDEEDIASEDSVALKKLLDSAPDEIKKELITKMAELGTIFYFTSKENKQIIKSNPEFAPLIDALDQMIEVEEDEPVGEEDGKDENIAS